MKKICIIRHYYYIRDPRVRKEAEALIDKECEVDVICLKDIGEKSKNSINGVNIYRLPLRHRRGNIIRYIFEYTLSFMLFAVVVSFLYFKKRYVVIQVNTLPDFLVFVTLIPKLCGAKVMLDMHEAMPELLRSKFGLSKRHPLTKLVELSERLSTQYADCVLAVGESVLQLYMARGLGRNKAVIIPNTPDDCMFDYQKYNRQEARNSGKRFVVISHGTLLERYGFQVLIQAVPYLKQCIPNLRVIILGDGEFLDSLKKLAQQLRIQNCVNFMGRIPLERVPLEISEADISVVPIMKDEFTDIMAPNKLFEYVAMRKPVVAPRIKGIQDYFDDTSLMFFESGDHEDLARCIVELYHNPEKRHELAENAYRRYERMRWSVTKKTYLKVIEDLVG